MAGKVAEEAQVKKPEKKDDIPTLEPRLATNEELATQIAGEAVKSTMKEFMPMFERILQSVADQKQTPVQANVTVQDNLTTTQSRVIRDMNKEFDRRLAQNRNFLARIAGAPAKDFRIMSIPRMFAKYFGSELPVGWNGSVIQVPINGKPFRVHKGFIPIIQQTLNYEDQKVAYMEQTDFDDTTMVDGVESIGRV